MMQALLRSERSDTRAEKRLPDEVVIVLDKRIFRQIDVKAFFAIEAKDF